MKANLFRLTNIVSLGSAIHVQSLAPGLPLGLCKLNSVRPIHKQPDNKPNPRSFKLAKTMALFTFFYMLVLKFFQLIPSAPGLPLCNSPPPPAPTPCHIQLQATVFPWTLFCSGFLIPNTICWDGGKNFLSAGPEGTRIAKPVHSASFSTQGRELEKRKTPQLPLQSGDPWME